MNAQPRPRTIVRYRDPNTGEQEKSAKCLNCHHFIEDWGGEWRHSDTDSVECNVPIHEPAEEWCGYPITICSYCGVPWPCESAS